jgi:hypothetical protein
MAAKHDPEDDLAEDAAVQEEESSDAASQQSHDEDSAEEDGSDDEIHEPIESALDDQGGSEDEADGEMSDLDDEDVDMLPEKTAKGMTDVMQKLLAARPGGDKIAEDQRDALNPFLTKDLGTVRDIKAQKMREKREKVSCMVGLPTNCLIVLMMAG